MGIEEWERLGTRLDWQKKVVADKILQGEPLTLQERLKAAEWIVGRPVQLPEKRQTRGRKTGVTDESLENALLFRELRPQCQTATECYRKILESKKKDASPESMDSIRKSITAGEKALEAGIDCSAIGRSLGRVFIKNVMKELATPEE